MLMVTTTEGMLNRLQRERKKGFVILRFENKSLQLPPLFFVNVLHELALKDKLQPAEYFQSAETDTNTS